MRRYCCFIALITCSTLVLKAQSLKGVTGKVDTSYSTYSAYKSTLKKYPGISIVPPVHFDNVKERRNLVYRKLKGRKLHIDAFIPQFNKAKVTPAVLIIHGGGWRSGNRGQHVPLAQNLAGAGYAAFTVEYRLSTEALYPAAIYDIKSALRWMRAHAKKYHIKPNQIAVLGFSSGGEMAAFTGVTSDNPAFEERGSYSRYPSTAQALIDIDGTLSFVHPESGEGDDSRSTSAASYWLGYSKKENPELWAKASPLYYAQSNKAPFLFINSSVERMHAGRDDFQKILNENNVYSEVHTFPNSPHSFCLFNPWFQQTVDYVVTFLQKTF
jgi:acetyl esterase/lipase